MPTLDHALALAASPGAIWVGVASIGAVALLFIRRTLEQRSVQRRLGTEDLARTAPTTMARIGEVPDLFDSRLDQWLYVSGFRSQNAPAVFLWAQAGAIAVGAILSLLIANSGAVETGRQWVSEVPGGVGSLFAPIFTIAPWIIFGLVTLVPVAYVRRRRREIVAATERDLPVALGLLATLVESGVGFDAALDRVHGAMGTERPLAVEFETFRSEARAGIPRVVSFRRIAERLDVPAVSVFVSAMIHAEHVGASVAETLRRQADEVWSRRRERAIQRAQTLPTKLAFPLVICFLPGVFVWTFGPAVAEFIRIAEGVLENRP
ncbi:MAG: type II secretion system F family protein [Planctomycetota bacterium]